MQTTFTSEIMCVRVERLRGSSAGSLMSDMRTWLDHQGIQPKVFKAITLAFGQVAFDFEFRHLESGIAIPSSLRGIDPTPELSFPRRFGRCRTARPFPRLPVRPLLRRRRRTHRSSRGPLA